MEEKTVGQKMIMVLIVLSIIAVIFCVYELIDLSGPIGRMNTIVSGDKIFGGDLAGDTEILNGYLLSQTLSIIGLIIAGIILFIGIFISPSVNRNAKAKLRQETKEKKPSLSDLEELKSLLDKGIITDDEFAQKKKQILGI